MKYPGTLVLIAGATGSGKGALIKQAKATHPEIVYPVSATTRAMRPGETDGSQYHFLTQKEFENQIAADEFLEWARIDDNYYGTPKSEVVPALSEGKLVIREMDVQGIHQVQKLLPDSLITVYIDAGGWDTLARRIQSRAPMSEEELLSRRKRFDYEQEFKSQANHVISNLDGHLDEAVAELNTIIETILPSAENSAN